MSSICKIFGHSSRGYYDRTPYLKVPESMWEGKIWRDGTGRGHVDLKADCDRCGREYVAATIHVPANKLKGTADDR